MWKGMVEARKSNEKEICLEIYKDEMRAVKRCKYHSKKKTNEEFVRKMNQNANGNRKIFLKEEGKANGRKLENFSRIKKKKQNWESGSGSGETWEEYFEDLYNITTTGKQTGCDCKKLCRNTSRHSMKCD